MPSTPPPVHLTGVQPSWAVEGGQITIHGSGFPLDRAELPEVRIGDIPARVVCASSSAMSARVPAGLDGGRTPVRVTGAAGETMFIDVGATFVTGLHQVDNPVFDPDGNLYVTYSGARGQRVPVSIFRVRPNGAREAFVSGIVNPTSMAFDADGSLYVSSRFEGTVYRVTPDASVQPVATDLGVPCGLAFAPDGTLFVGDRSGTIFHVTPSGQARAFATLPPSVAAFHLAVGPDECLYVTAPTLSPRDHVYRIDQQGKSEIVYSGFGRPQGLVFDARGALYVVEALAGSSGLFRLHPDAAAECVLAGVALVGVAIDPGGGLVVVSNDTAYRLAVNIRPLGRA